QPADQEDAKPSHDELGAAGQRDKPDMVVRADENLAVWKKPLDQPLQAAKRFPQSPSPIPGGLLVGSLQASPPMRPGIPPGPLPIATLLLEPGRTPPANGSRVGT